MNEKIVFARPIGEVARIIGNLFYGLLPPCDHAKEGFLTVRYDSGQSCDYYVGADMQLAIQGTTTSGRYARILVFRDRCEFYGSREDLDAVLNGRCPERRCSHG